MKQLILVRTFKIITPRDLTTCFGEQDNVMYTKVDEFVYLSVLFYLEEDAVSEQYFLTLEYKAFTKVKPEGNAHGFKVIETYLDEAIKLESLAPRYFNKVKVYYENLITQANDISPRTSLNKRKEFIDAVYVQPSFDIANITVLLNTKIGDSLYIATAGVYSNSSIEDLVDDIKHGSI